MLGACVAAPVFTEAGQIHTTTSKIFDGGTATGVGKAWAFRIPSIVRGAPTTVGGNPNILVAFAEGRQGTCNDYGSSARIACRRSLDNGATWTEAPFDIATPASGSFNNPTAVTDMTNHRIWLFFLKVAPWVTMPPYTWVAGDKKVMSCYSDSNGAAGSWSSPQERPELTDSTLSADYIGPGEGIQTTQADAGRLIIPAYLRNFYSDDHGANWKMQWLISPGDPTFGWGTESSIAECFDGSLFRNDRPANAPFTAVKARVGTRGDIDAGQLDPHVGGFDPYTSQTLLPDPQSEGSMWVYNMSAPHRLMFLNSAKADSRLWMEVRISYDDGKTWKFRRALYPTEPASNGEGGYSAMAKTNDACLGALVEVCDVKTDTSPTGHRSLDFHKFNLEWMRSGAGDPP